MKIKGKVLEIKTDSRQVVGKDGNRRDLNTTILALALDDEIVEAKTYEPVIPFPAKGGTVEITVRKYERYGLIGQVIF